MSKFVVHRNLRTKLILLFAACGFAGFALSVHVGGNAPAPRTANAAEPKTQPAKKKPPADNTACYVCHLTLEKEHITAVHFEEDIGCVDCHGRSKDHEQDEMQMTTPDLLFGRSEVDRMCSECHDDPHEGHEDDVEAFRKKWRGRARPNGRSVTPTSICTDCHGTHNIDKGLKKEEGPKKAEWVNLFNGRDLTGWKTSGDAAWKIKRGRIVGKGGAKGGVLWTTAEQENFLLAVTFQTDWPNRAGIYVRSTDQAPGARIEIFENKTPPQYTGSVTAPSKGIALANLRKDLFDPGGFNTIAAEVRENRIQVWLNGEEVGAARMDIPKKGRIGIYLQGGEDLREAEFTVGEVRIQELPKDVGQ